MFILEKIAAPKNKRKSKKPVISITMLYWRYLPMQLRNKRNTWRRLVKASIGREFGTSGRIKFVR